MKILREENWVRFSCSNSALEEMIAGYLGCSTYSFVLFCPDFKFPSWGEKFLYLQGDILGIRKCKVIQFYFPGLLSICHWKKTHLYLLTILIKKYSLPRFMMLRLAWKTRTSIEGPIFYDHKVPKVNHQSTPLHTVQLSILALRHSLVQTRVENCRYFFLFTYILRIFY